MQKWFQSVGKQKQKYDSTKHEFPLQDYMYFENMKKHAWIVYNDSIPSS